MDSFHTSSSAHIRDRASYVGPIRAGTKAASTICRIERWVPKSIKAASITSRSPTQASYCKDAGSKNVRLERGSTSPSNPFTYGGRCDFNEAIIKQATGLAEPQAFDPSSYNPAIAVFQYGAHKGQRLFSSTITFQRPFRCTYLFFLDCLAEIQYAKTVLQIEIPLINAALQYMQADQGL